ncbi:MAG: hypothetical protein ACPLSY_03635 [Moorellaceae bacterium]
MTRVVHQLELDFLEENYRDLAAKFKDKWIAISGYSLVGVGDSAAGTLRQAVAAGCRRPVLVRLAPEAWEEPFFRMLSLRCKLKISGTGLDGAGGRRRSQRPW